MDSPFELVVASTLILALILVGLVLFVRQYSKRVLAHQDELKRQEKEKQSALLNASIEAQEGERARIGSDIHDDIGPLLSTLKLYVNRIKMIDDATERNTYIDSLGDQMDTVISEIRRVAKDLVPMVLIEFGLIAALENLCGRIEKLDQFEIKFRNSATHLDLSKNEELAIYRIVQEFVNNSIKYSQASQIDLSLSSNPVTILIADNGIGFDQNKISQDPKSGLGLKNMSARAQAIGADLQITSKEDEGTRIILTLPK